MQGVGFILMWLVYHAYCYICYARKPKDDENDTFMSKKNSMYYIQFEIENEHEEEEAKDETTI